MILQMFLAIIRLVFSPLVSLSLSRPIKTHNSSFAINSYLFFFLIFNSYNLLAEAGYFARRRFARRNHDMEHTKYQ